MIKCVDGDILTFKKGIIAQQVNCQGVMGSGLADTIRNKYPKAYEFYKLTCDNYGRKYMLLGEVCFTPVEDELTIANIFGQETYGRENKVYTDADALLTGLKKVVRYAQENSLDVAIPSRIGCGLGNGDWDDIFNRITMLDTEGIILYICKL